MHRSRSAISALSTILCSALCGAAAGAQEPYSPLAPKGTVRIGALGEYSSFSELFGIEGAEGPGPHRLRDLFGGRLGSRTLPGLAVAEASVRQMLDEEHPLVAGVASAALEKSAARVPLSIDVGVFDWLTVGGSAPLVQNETEFSMAFGIDSMAVNAGFSPGVEDPASVRGFLDQLGASIGAYDGFRGLVCAPDPGSAACMEATELLSQARAFRGRLAAMYGSLFAPLRWSAAGAALQARLAAFGEAFAAAGVTAFPGAVPLAGKFMTAEDLALVTTDPAFGIQATHPLDQWRSLWRLGDVEVRADARAFETGAADGPSRLAAGGGATVRLPTGAQDDPGNFVDAGSGDGQLDVELRGWLNGRWRGFGAWARLAYGLQLEGSSVRRVFPPERPFAPKASETALRWNPGDYFAVELSPWYRVADAVTLMAGYRLFRKGEDSFAPAAAAPGADGQPPSGAARDLSALVPGTAMSASQLIAGVVYSRGAASARDGTPAKPLEARMVYRRAFGGSGNMPAAHGLEVGFRFFARLWGRPPWEGESAGAAPSG